MSQSGLDMVRSFAQTVVPGVRVELGLLSVNVWSDISPGLCATYAPDEIAETGDEQLYVLTVRALDRLIAQWQMRHKTCEEIDVCSSMVDRLVGQALWIRCCFHNYAYSGDLMRVFDPSYVPGTRGSRPKSMSKQKLTHTLRKLETLPEYGFRSKLFEASVYGDTSLGGSVRRYYWLASDEEPFRAAS